MNEKRCMKEVINLVTDYLLVTTHKLGFSILWDKTFKFNVM